MPSHQAIAQRLPDLPRWVEVRDLLLGQVGDITGFQTVPELAFILRDAGTAFVIGRPTVEAIRAGVPAARDEASVIAPYEQAVWLAQILPDWSCTRMLVHQLADPQRLPDVPVGRVGFLDPARLNLLALPAELRQELVSGAEHSLIAAAFVDHQPVSFCYAGAMTESWWDVSIDTLPAYRRRGYAVLCATYLIRHLRPRGKQPVWQAVEDNPASWRLAQKLGFVAVDELALFTPHAPGGVLHGND